MKHEQHTITSRSSTLFLRLALAVVGVVIGIICVLVLSAIYTGFNDEYPNLTHLRYPLLAIIATSTVPFYASVAQAFRLLQLIDKNKAFSSQSTRGLQRIKSYAFIFSALYALSLYIVFEIAQVEDAPGMILIIGSIFVGVPLTIGVFMAILQKLLENALELKSENDLTV